MTVGSGGCSASLSRNIIPLDNVTSTNELFTELSKMKTGDMLILGQIIFGTDPNSLRDSVMTCVSNDDTTIILTGLATLDMSTGFKSCPKIRLTSSLFEMSYYIANNEANYTYSAVSRDVISCSNVFKVIYN